MTKTNKNVVQLVQFCREWFEMFRKRFIRTFTTFISLEI